jgi:hypothetical protein
MRWKHKAEPADIELVLVRERPYVADLLLTALRRADPHLFEPLRSAGWQPSGPPATERGCA